ncbi:MAG: OmpA family protein [Gammaproteobacteria bacterium]|nr:OmpA family protein [Gammaproteobacteria bacterium]
MNKNLVSIAIAAIIAASSTQSLASQDDDNNHRPYTAIGVGAASGAILAGPVGMVVGGLIGNIIGRHETSEIEDIDNLAKTELATDRKEVAMQQNSANPVIVASIDQSIPVVTDHAMDNLKEIISKDLTVGVYFKAGSIDVEKFYSPQLDVIASLLNEISDLRVILDGYSDRQGDENKNLRLSAERLLSVRDYLINSGVDENRMILRAHGEKDFVSQPGDLGAYVFDRRVVVSFESPADANNNVASISGKASF